MTGVCLLLLLWMLLGPGFFLYVPMALWGCVQEGMGACWHVPFGFVCCMVSHADRPAVSGLVQWPSEKDREEWHLHCLLLVSVV